MLRLLLCLVLLGLVILIGLGRVSDMRRRHPPGEGAAAATPSPGGSASVRLRNTRSAELDSVTRLSVRVELSSQTQRHYLDSLVQATDSVVRHWPVTAAPIWFAFLPGGTADFRPEMPGEARAALDAWSPLALGLRLLETTDTAQATLIVDWTSSLPERAGVTNVSWDPTGRILRVRVTLATRDPKNGEPLSDHARRVIALHEMGHALGLPHSADPGDAMHPVTLAEQPSDRDLTSIRLLYSLPTGWIGGGQRPPHRQ